MNEFCSNLYEPIVPQQKHHYFGLTSPFYNENNLTTSQRLTPLKYPLLPAETLVEEDNDNKDFKQTNNSRLNNKKCPNLLCPKTV